ncbi:unnamed protein product [Acanthosepion pharaonis]|uniref:Uncharacterized protein n=1 Tax=Acanthosepion pharaonis TaxID=158019 RepID=A0A812C6U8_ACAPH|nr:unnamed protein product [Sepia pharaonis]
MLWRERNTCKNVKCRAASQAASLFLSFSLVLSLIHRTKACVVNYGQASRPPLSPESGRPVCCLPAFVSKYLVSFHHSPDSSSLHLLAMESLPHKTFFDTGVRKRLEGVYVQFLSKKVNNSLKDAIWHLTKITRTHLPLPLLLSLSLPLPLPLSASPSLCLSFPLSLSASIG